MNKTSIDRIVEQLTNGQYVVSNINSPIYNIKKLSEYCKDHNIKPSDLSEEELKQFEVCYNPL
jgi:hypothetical protein